MSHSYSIAIRPNKMDHSIVTPDTPAMRPPNGVIPNFDHPHGIISEIYATLILSMMISTVFVWTRLYTRYFIIKAHGWEDCMFQLSLSFFGHSRTELTEDTSFIAWVRLPFYLSKLLNPANTSRVIGRTHGICSNWVCCGRWWIWGSPVGYSIAALYRTCEGKVLQRYIEAHQSLRLT